MIYHFRETPCLHWLQQNTLEHWALCGLPGTSLQNKSGKEGPGWLLWFEYEVFSPKPRVLKTRSPVGGAIWGGAGSFRCGSLEGRRRSQVGSQAVHGPFLSVPLCFLKDVNCLPALQSPTETTKRNNPFLKLFFLVVIHNDEKLYNGRKEV